jgi:hypothetical protein
MRVAAAGIEDEAMGDPRKCIVTAVILSVAVAARPSAADVTTAGAPPAPRQVPGLTATDTHPGACVDCHVVYRERGMDVRLSVLLKKWTDGDVEPGLLALARASAPAGLTVEGRHPEVARSLGDIPAACLDCHGSASNEAPPFARLIHLVHLAGAGQNHFMAEYQGECTLCHKLDRRTGEWSIPSRPET